MIEQHLYLMKFVVLTGMAGWLTLVWINVITDRNATVGSVALIMSMKLITSDKTMTTKLVNRRVEASGWHKLGAVTIIGAQAVTVVLLWRAVWLVGVGFGAFTISADALAAVHLSLAAFATLWMFMLIGGMWFIYWLKQPALQQLHITLLILSIAVSIMFSATA